MNIPKQPACPLCCAPMAVCQCGTTPAAAPIAIAPVAPALPNPTRFRIRYGIAYCTRCDLAVQFCRGHGPPDAQSADGDGSSLAKRIAEALGKR